MSRTGHAAMLAAVCAFLVVPAAAGGQGSTVTVANCNESEFRAAIAAVPDGGTVDFDCDGTITLTGDTIDNPIDPGKSLTIDGGGHDVTISGDNKVPLFFNTSRRTLTLRHLTLAEGNAFGDNGTSDTGDDGPAFGGAVQNFATLIADDVEFVGNQAFDSGGAIYTGSPAGQVTITNSRFSGNHVLCATLCGARSLAAGGGGAIATEAGGVTSIDGSTFEDNYTQFLGAGGAIFGARARQAPDAPESLLLGPIVISDSVFKRNETQDSIDEIGLKFRPGGGAIATVSHPLTVTDSSFEDNKAISRSFGYGGAILVSDSDSSFAPPPAVSISESTFTGNRAVRHPNGGLGAAGGALWTRANSNETGDSEVTSVTGSTFIGNVADRSGGAIENVGMLAIGDSIIMDNVANTPGEAGGVSGLLGVTTISGSTLTDNLTRNCRADGRAGAPASIVDGGGNTESPGKTCFGRADLAITKTGSPDPVTVGQDVVYTLSVTNGGPDDATGVEATDQLPAGMNFKATGTSAKCTNDGGTVTCDFGSLASGAAPKTAQIVVRATAAGAISNTATVEGAEPDPAGSNDSSTATTQVNPAPAAGGRLDAKKVQIQKGKRIKVRLKVGAAEDVSALGKGTVTVGPRGSQGRATLKDKPIRLVKATRRIEGGQTKTLTLKLRAKKSNAKVFRALRKGKRVKADTEVRFRDDAGNSRVLRKVVRLKAPNRAR